MATNIVKCGNCNVVINETLAFICNKLDVMDEESIARICVSAFTESEIVNAKNLLFDSISTTKRKKIRKRQGKTLRDIDDIVCLLKETDPEEIPIFVARDLQKLPPVLFDHVDVTRLLKDLVRMRGDIDRISEEYATANQLKELRAEVEALKNASIVNNFSRNITVKRGACALSSFEHESGPMGLSPICGTFKSAENQSAVTPLKKQRIILAGEGSAIKTPCAVMNVKAPANETITAARAMSKVVERQPTTFAASVANCAQNCDQTTSPRLCVEKFR